MYIVELTLREFYCLLFTINKSHLSCMLLISLVFMLHGVYLIQLRSEIPQVYETFTDTINNPFQARIKCLIKVTI